MGAFGSGISLEVIVRDATHSGTKGLLVKAAKEALSDAIRTGEGSKHYTSYVNGVKGRQEESVVLPGPILYHFNWLGDAARYALTFLRARWSVRGPGRDGHFTDSYFFMANGQKIRMQDAIRYDEIVIINDQPYSRKAQTGYKGFYRSKGLYLDCKRALKREFKSVISVRLMFIQLNGGYVLKKSKRRKVDSTGRSHSGEALRYPCLRITRS